jgi:hypothetical protein
MQVVLGPSNYIHHGEEELQLSQIIDSLLPWLTEQFKRKERKENISMFMEAAITIFVLVEVLLQLHRIKLPL